MFKDCVKSSVRASASFALRHTPEVPGRWHVANVINKYFPPTSPALCTAKATMRLGHKIRVDLRSHTEFHTYYLGDYDNEAINASLRLIRTDAVVLDVGANIGFWSIALGCHVRGHGRVHAFEPVGANRERLIENVEENGLNNTIKIHGSGLSDENALAQISLREDFARGAATGNAAIVIDSDDLTFACEEIRVDRLDDIFDSLRVEHLDFIKVDIEGHEHKFLAGAASTIRRFRPILYVELNNICYQRQGRDVAAVFEEWLTANSYASALHNGRKWRLDTVRNRKFPMDNAFFFPAEVAEDRVREMNY